MTLQLFTKEDCPFCVSTKAMLYEAAADYEEYMIGKGITREQVMRLFPDAKIVPIIIHNGRRLSGPDELKEIIARGDL